MIDEARGRAFMAGLEKPDVANARLTEWHRQIGQRLRRETRSHEPECRWNAGANETCNCGVEL